MHAVIEAVCISFGCYCCRAQLVCGMAPTQQHGSIMQQGCGSTWTWYTKVSKWASEEGTPNLIFQLSFYVTYRPGPTPEEETSVFIEFVGCMIYDEY
jgi:hypothetical protein